MLEAPEALPELGKPEALEFGYSQAELANNEPLTRALLDQAIIKNQPKAIEQLLKIYQTFSQQDPILVLFAKAKLAKSQGNYAQSIAYFREILAQNPSLNTVRIELAMVFFLEQQNKAAVEQFKKARAEADLPPDIAYVIDQYLQALEQREGWNVDFGLRYLNESNVNNVSSAPKIENTAFVKNESMLPQKAKGVGYSVGLSRDFNLVNAHYLHFSNQLYGKTYWTNHDYDDISNRTYLGYAYKSARQNWQILPFYERQWYGNHRYKKAIGLRLAYNRWLNTNWQLSLAGEYAKQDYHERTYLKGNHKLASATLLWQPNARQFWYVGGDVSREQAQVKQYGYVLKTLRLGWGQEWGWGISSRLNLSLSKRNYQDNLVLGNVFRFDKKREDKIYSANLSLWKRDWHYWGITPKLGFMWKQQQSNFDTLYSYTDKSFNLFLKNRFNLS
ncbi:hypothetical protein A4G20_04085 [Pasteurellaceae bacterium RH1A]|nr:hypothetical protein A4G20_04085 [Pasteurellaceae bacterium RH1A]